jgi:aspartyl-tRNA(Asn)/glutamyl-tRNA(Gln) amidotransferase subunit C
MATSPDFDIDHVAKLARIALSPGERAAFSGQLRDVLAHIALLQEVDVTGVEPTAHAFPMDNVWGEDRAIPGLPAEAALRNAPSQRDGMFAVPKVVE